MAYFTTRRRWLAAAASAGLAAVAGDAWLIEPSAVDVTRHQLALPGLAPALDGLRLACVADVHLQGAVGAAPRTALAALARERPDVVILAGDICNHYDDLPTLAAWAREARGSLATFATLGNWEHDAGIDVPTATKVYEHVGVELLVNASAVVRVRDAVLRIVGLDDPVLGHPDLSLALRDVVAGEPTLLTLHAPGYVDSVTSTTLDGVAVILAGHTHGGQIRVPGWTPYTPSGSGRFVAGWYRDTPAPLYVTRGIGTVAIHARLFCRPEIPIFTLRTTPLTAHAVRRFS